MSTVEKLITENIEVWALAHQKKNGNGRGNGGKVDLVGIKKLRELILELAVRGKLVPQDPKDEPASVLLERIAAEKLRLVKEKKIKPTRKLQEISDDEKLFVLPMGWRWQRFQDITKYIQRGKGPKYAEDGDVRVVSQKCVQRSGFDLAPARYVTNKSLKEYQPERFLRSKDILWNSTGTGTVGRAIVLEQIEGTLVADSHVTIIRPLEVSSRFIWCYIMSPSIQTRIEPDHENALVSGTTKQVELNTSSVLSLCIPTPPLSEQRRIVVKVDELMALCDQLEQQTETSLTAHAVLVENLLKTLTLSADAEELKANWNRIAEHFTTLFTTEESIDQLKQTILQLAVMGKLVPQDPNDKPASKLLKRIADEKARLVKEKKLKRERELPEITEEEKPFDVPEGWEWCRLTDVASVVDPNPSHRMPKYVESGVPFISTENFIDGDEIDFSRGKRVEQFVLDQQVSKFDIRRGAFAISRIGTIGKTRFLPTERTYCMSHALCVISPYLEGISHDYLRFVVSAESSLVQANHGVQSIGVPDLGVGVIRSLLIPVPPLGKQHRIVVKVNQLMALCDALKAQITKTSTTRVQLAEALVAQAVA